MVEHLGTIQIVMKRLNALYLYDRPIIMGQYTDHRQGVLDEAGGGE